MLKYLRIAVTALSLTAYVLLITVWVRSYRYIDTFTIYRGGNWYGIQSQPGHLKLTLMFKVGLSDGWFFRSGMPVQDRYDPKTISWNGNYRSVFTAYCAHWLTATFPVAFAVIPWIKWRFRLRTLLIATALVAIVLGIIVVAR